MVRSEGNTSLKNPVTPAGFDPETVRLVAQRLNHYANPGPACLIYLHQINDLQIRAINDMVSKGTVQPRTGHEVSGGGG
jgi:hypothetical protein